jgi:hypothetical protein
VTTGVGPAEGGGDVEFDAPQATTIMASRPIAPIGNRLPRPA